MAIKKGAKKAAVKVKLSAQNSAKLKGKPRGKPFEPDNPYKFKSKAELGGVLDPKINAGGRPKLLGESYRAMLAQVDEKDPQQRTNAERIAETLGKKARNGDVSAAREIRSATEGEKIRTWRDDVIDLLRAGAVSPEDVIAEIGNDLASELIVASGIRRNENG